MKTIEIKNTTNNIINHNQLMLKINEKAIVDIETYQALIKFYGEDIYVDGDIKGQAKDIINNNKKLLDENENLKARILELEKKQEKNNPNQIANSDESEELRQELLAKAKELGLEPHHKTGVEKLKQMIEEKLIA